MRLSADDLALVQHGGELDVRRDHQVERRPRTVELIQVDLRHRRTEKVAEPCAGQSVGEPLRGDHAEVLAVLVVDHDPMPLHRRQLGESGRDRVTRPQVQCGVETDRLRLHPADRGIQVLGMHVLRQHS